MGSLRACAAGVYLAMDFEFFFVFFLLTLLCLAILPTVGMCLGIVFVACLLLKLVKSVFGD